MPDTEVLSLADMVHQCRDDNPGVKPALSPVTNTKVQDVFAVSLAKFIDRQVSIESVVQALEGMSDDQKYFIAHSSVVRRAMIDLHVRLDDAALAIEAATKESEPHSVDVPWTFAKPDAIENNVLFFVLSGRPCFCSYRFRSDGEGVIISVHLHWMVIGPPDCTVDMALLMVKSLCDSTEVVCGSIHDGVDSGDFRLYESYTIACSSGSNMAIKKGSRACHPDFPGEVLFMAWDCTPKDYKNIDIDDIAKLRGNIREYSFSAARVELTGWRCVQRILTENPEASFRLEELVAKNLGMRDVRGTIDRTITMLETDTSVFPRGFSE
jgi:hypothetical protein